MAENDYRYFHISNIEVRLDGNPVSAFEGDFSAFHCLNEYVRFMDLTSPETSAAPNPMSYDRFRVRKFKIPKKL